MLLPEVRAQLERWVEVYTGYPTPLGSYIKAALTEIDNLQKQLDDLQEVRREEEDK